MEEGILKSPLKIRKQVGDREKKKVWAELELDRQSPIKRLGSENCLPARLDRQSPPKAETGRDGYFRPKKHGFKKSGSENSSCARLGPSKERKITRKEDSSSNDDGESKSSSVSSKESDVNEMEEAEKGSASDEGGRRGSDSSSIDDWLRRKGKDSIPLIQRDPGGWVSIPNRNSVRSEPLQRRRPKDISLQCFGSTERVSIATPEKGVCLKGIYGNSNSRWLLQRSETEKEPDKQGEEEQEMSWLPQKIIQGG
ncbi:hypothetical protein MRB53_022911 [Persea americana]|uniref:Uncharacterized protein n=1 Tax=Persea americana TaxID=3435 RepID=A0ACC2L8G1_PERAE|nr:hypothetical protein MRB53_022911 [Persea americana]